MQYEPASFATTHLSLSLKRVQFDSVVPLAVPPSTWLFARVKFPIGSEQEKQLSELLRRTNFDALRQAIFAAVVPVPIAKLIEQFSGELERRGRNKDAAIVAGDFQLAALIRDEEIALRSAARKLLPADLTVDVEHVIQAIRSLGYVGDVS